MDFYEILDQVIDLLKRRERASYRALKLQFKLDDEYLEVLKDELIKVQQLAVDQDGEMLVWTGAVGSPEPDVRRGTEDERHFQALTPSGDRAAPGAKAGHVPYAQICLQPR